MTIIRSSPERPSSSTTCAAPSPVSVSRPESEAAITLACSSIELCFSENTMSREAATG